MYLLKLTCATHREVRQTASCSSIWWEQVPLGSKGSSIQTPLGFYVDRCLNNNKEACDKKPTQRWQTYSWHTGNFLKDETDKCHIRKRCVTHRAVPGLHTVPTVGHTAYIAWDSWWHPDWTKPCRCSWLGVSLAGKDRAAKSVVQPGLPSIWDFTVRSIRFPGLLPAPHFLLNPRKTAEVTLLKPAMTLSLDIARCSHKRQTLEGFQKPQLLRQSVQTTWPSDPSSHWPILSCHSIPCVWLSLQHLDSTLSASTSPSPSISSELRKIHWIQMRNVN